FGARLTRWSVRDGNCAAGCKGVIQTMSHSSAASVSTQIGNVPKMKRFKSSFRQWWPYYLMMAPALIFFFIFYYMPVWEAKIAFEQLRIIPPNIWVGLKHFELLFSSTIFWQVLANTLIISAMKIVFVFPVPIIVALL